MLTGISLAILATIIWSGNFIVARGVYKQIPPISLSFYRWLAASVIILPFAYNSIKQEIGLIRFNFFYFFCTSLAGITLFNTFVYIAGHYTEAVNLALIGTTSSPIFALILAAVFLKERIGMLRIMGMLLCIAGILYLLSKGSQERLISLHFSIGDLWILTAALCFAVYNTFVKKKPAGISPMGFLSATFILGTLLLFPAYLVELNHSSPVIWNANLVFIVIYLGLGTSVISFFCWNAAIERLGAARTALFGNLIPVFSTLEAVLLLHERITWIHGVSGLLVIGGLVLANMQSKREITLGVKSADRIPQKNADNKKLL